MLAYGPRVNNDASINQDPNLPDYLFSNALITDTNTSTAAATVFTLDTPATTSSEYCGSFADSNIRIVKTGGGTFMPEGPMCLIQTAAGLEIDDGMVELRPEFNSTDSGNNLALTMNGGTLDLEGGQIEQQSPPQLHLSQLDGTAAATITDYSSTLAGSGSQYYSTEIVMQLVAQSHPSIFAGVIQQQAPSAANDIAGQPIELVLDGVDQGSEGTLVLTGANAYLGGTVVDAGCLQVGDGVTPSASIEGPVSVSSADGLVFDVAAGVSETFAGPLGVYPLYGTWPISSAVGSMLKTGPGTLTLAIGGASASSTFGAITVNGGTLEFGSSNYLPKSTSLVVDDGATVDMDGHSITATNGAFSTVTLNNGSIINSSATRATLTASDSFNLANGTIGRKGRSGWRSKREQTDRWERDD